jgi:3-keto-5-aminohexanoate cleavage enzyme
MSQGPVIVTVAPTGGFLTRSHHPYVPTQPRDIADDVYRCFEAGASMAALHARRPDDTATCDGTIYRQINDLVREKCDVIINNSTGGGVNGDMVEAGSQVISFAERLRGLEGGAETCTLDAFTAYASTSLGEYLMDTPPSRIKELLERMRDRGIKPEWEVFNPSHITQELRLLAEEGEYDRQPYLVNLVLGMDAVFQNALPYEPKILDWMVGLLPPSAVFTATVCGDQQIRGLTHSLLLGGHVRVGIEDTPFAATGVPMSNVQQVEHIVRIIRELGLEPATPSEAREILGLTGSTSVLEPSDETEQGATKWHA